MADDKKSSKPAPKPPKSPKTLTGFAGEMFVLLLGILVLVTLFERASAFFSAFFQNRGYATGSNSVNVFLNSLYYFLGSVVLFFTITSNIISVLLLMGIVYALIRLTELNKDENEKLNQQASAITGEKEEHKQWDRITDHINTDNPSDWRLAILEADIILDELLSKIGTVGATIGDKLKQVEKSDFTTIDSAWEAHKVRNMIAHEGQEFLLSKREAQRVIRLYEDVFREFHFI